MQVQIERPVREDDSDTDVTAFYAYNRVVHAAPLSSAAAGERPVVFKRIDSQAAAEKTSVVRKPETSEPAPVGVHEAAGDVRHHKAYYRWAIVAAAAVLLLLLGFAIL
jgi:hypothetical protein